MKATPLQHREQSPSHLPSQTIPVAQAAAPSGLQTAAVSTLPLCPLLLTALATSGPAVSFLYWPTNTLLARLQVTSAASKSLRTVKMPKSTRGTGFRTRARGRAGRTAGAGEEQVGAAELRRRKAGCPAAELCPGGSAGKRLKMLPGEDRLLGELSRAQAE